MKKILFLLLTVVFLFSCENKDEYTIILKQSGKLKVKLAGDDGKAIANTKIKLYSYYSGESSSSLDAKTTDANGIVDFGELNQGTYTLVSKDVKIGNAKYYVNKPVMLVSAFDGTVDLNPQEFVGKLTLNFSVYYSSLGTTQKGANLNVALIDISEYNDTLSHENKLKKAVVRGVTNSEGKIVFNSLPSSYVYAAYVYIDEEKGGGITNSTYSVNKDDEREYNVTITETMLNGNKVKANLTFQYYGYKNGSYGYQKFSNLNIVIVKWSDYSTYTLSNKSVSTILNYKVANGITNSLGYVSLSLKADNEYRIFAYTDATHYQWVSSLYINYNDYTSSLEVEESYFGL